MRKQSAMETGVGWLSLGERDAGAVYDLHIAAIGEVARPDLIRPETRAFFESILSGGGRIVGVSDDAGLLAYGVLQWDLPPNEDLRPLFGLPPGAPFAKLAGAAVRPGCWGRGLQESAIAERVGMASRLGLTHLYATSAPGNWRSWTNLLNQGFLVRALIEQYGGALRYIVYRDLDAKPEPEYGEGTWCPAADTGAQRQLLADGCVGAAWRCTAPEHHEVFYRASA